MDHSFGALLAQKNDKSAKQAIYYLNRTLIGAESCYNPVKKECLALIFTIQKTRHYLVRQTLYHFKSQSSIDSYDKAKFFELQIG